MKRLTCVLFLFLAASVLYSQSLLDNPDYKKSIEYKELYQKAMDEGEYEKALEYADLAKFHAEKSDEYVSVMIVRFRANQALNRLKDRISEVKSFGGNTTHPDVYRLATEGYGQASNLFTAGDYQGSLDQSNAAIDLLSDVRRTAKQTKELPAKYVVRLIPENRDCLWKIAGYPYIYGDPTLWPLLYQANKQSFPDPENPHLIVPGMILDIPERDKESRSGTWKNLE